MDRNHLSRLAHAHHPIAAPVGDDAAHKLLTRAVHSGDTVLDLGCGGAEWLLRALALRPDASAVGVDLSEPALAHADAVARRRGVRDRLVLEQADAASFVSPQRFDVVVAVGVAHVFGGLLSTLQAAAAPLRPGGRLLVGDGFWATSPSAGASEMLGEMDDLATVVDRVAAAGWTAIDGHVSTRHELDAYELAWCGSLAEWALDHRDDPDSANALSVADEHRTQWLRGYRESFGFVCLVLRRTAE